MKAAESAPEVITPEQVRQLSGYLREQTVFIVDAASASRRRLAGVLASLGANPIRIVLHSSVEEAVVDIKARKPKVILTDYTVGRRYGLDLVPAQKQALPDANDTLFLLVTSNTSQSAVARAAEEDVDSFILKPYTLNSLTDTITQSCVNKLFPNPYRKMIEDGKQLLFAGKIDESMVLFEKAMEMHSKPALACFYYGQAEMLKQAFLDAQGSYLKGLNFNRIHYKCLLGLYDLLMQRRMFAEAYEVIRRMQKYFPANPRRLASVIRLAVLNHKYTDIEQLYQVFKELEFRDEEITRYMCAGLIVSGQHALGADPKSPRGVELLGQASISCAGNPYFLRRVIEVLCEHGISGPMSSVMSRFPSSTYDGVDYLVSKFLQMDVSGDVAAAVQFGQGLVRDGHRLPVLYINLARRYLQLGKKQLAEDLVLEGIRKWPEEKSQFEPLISALGMN